MEVPNRFVPEGFFVFRLQGSLDLYNSPIVRTELRDCAVIQKNIVIDLRYVDYADSSGVGVLTYMLSYAKKNGILLKFSGIRGQVRNVLSLNRILDLMDIIPEENNLS